MEVVSEKATKVIQVSFQSSGGEPITPDSGTLRIDDIGSGENIRTIENLTFNNSYYNILTSSNENRILDADNIYEMREITITVTASGLTASSTYKYLIKNLQFHT